jgi:uncharacterized protein (DUF58 family)
MRSSLAAARSAIVARSRSWLRRRQGADADPVPLHRRRIYILPTPLGLVYGAMLFAMLLGGMNYSNNLGLALTFLLASLGMVTMHHCHGNLTGLSLRLLSAEPAFAGEEVCFRLLLENPTLAPRPRIELSADTAQPVTVDLAARGSAVAELRLPTSRRGHAPLERLVVATRHPLGLFRAWAVVHPDYDAIVWPKPAPRGARPPQIETDTGGAQDHARGEEDFAGLRPYQAGDGLRRIAWKAYARGRGLHTKQYAGTGVISHVFDWDSLQGLDTESRLSQLCRWVVDAHRDGSAFGLRLPAAAIPANIGELHRQRCLAALALHGEARA